MVEFDTNDAERAVEFEKERALERVIQEHLSADAEWLTEQHDLDERVWAVYGALLERGEDADLILFEAGVMEKGE